MANSEKKAPREKKPKKPKDPAKAAAREAQRAKRRDALKDLAKKDPVKFQMKIGFKEAKQLKVVGVDGKPIESWKQFALSKAKWTAEYWTKAAEKPSMSEKSVARKKAAFQKLKERLAKYEAELAGLVDEE